MIVWRTVDPNKLHPGFRADIEKFLGDSPFTWYVTYGYRSLAEQLTLYNAYLAGGPKAAPPGKSAHNYGKAVDIVLDIDPDKPGLQPTWNVALAGWVWLFAACKLHPRLKSGVSFNDADHIEQYKWQPNND